MREPAARRPCRAWRWRCLCLAALVISTWGCATRTIREQVYRSDMVSVVLRHQTKRGAVVDRGFAHPASLSSQRLVHVLGALEIETSEDTLRERRAAIHPELLRPIAEGLARGLAEASSAQEVALTAVRRERRIAVLHRDYLTSLVASVQGDRLVLHLSRVEWEIPKRSDEDGRAPPLPEPRSGERQMAFRCVPGPMMQQAGSQGLSVRWRDPLFDRPVYRAGAEGEGDGQPRRRTILMESPIPPEERAADPDASPDAPDR